MEAVLDVQIDHFVWGVPDLAAGIDDMAAPGAVLIVVDATNLRRNLFMATQIIELGHPVSTHFCIALQQKCPLSTKLGPDTPVDSAWRRLHAENRPAGC